MFANITKYQILLIKLYFNS